MQKTLLGGISPSQFLREYWQKKPLLIRQAIPGFRGVIATPELLRLAGNDDVESRLIKRQRGKWQLERGPFPARQFKNIQKNNWTVLIQDLNHFVAAGRELLQQFSFIPHARLDDLMVSFAAPGGGVGPHFDSYDVFLLQGEGRRRWRISAQRDLTLLGNAPLKILKNFKPEQEWTLSAGDMLYLPPNIAHDGVAESECTTYSIGFRAPSTQELVFNFLNHLQDTLQLEGMYADPDLRATDNPAKIGDAMVRQASRMLKQLEWDKRTCAQFLGIYLSEPKPHVYFTTPEDLLGATAFRRAVKSRGIALHLKSRMLRYKDWTFINGECIATPTGSETRLRELSDNWLIAPNRAIDQRCFKLLYQWYVDGYLALSREEQ